MIAPTRRAAGLIAAVVPLALVLVALDPGLAGFAVGCALLVLLAVVADALIAPTPRAIKAGLVVPERIHLGETGRVEITVEALGRHERDVPMTVLLEQRGEVARPRALATLLEGTKARLTIPLRPHRRGRLDLDALWLRWTGPLGLATVVRRIPVEAGIDVIPNVRGAGSAALRIRALDALQGLKPEAVRGGGAEFTSLREYATGDDPRHVDWKRSARHRRLVTREFEAERNHHVVLAFDTGRLMREPVGELARLDHGINAGLQLGSIALRAGDLVGLHGFDSSVRAYQAPVRGIGRFGHLQRATASLAYRPDETNYTLGLADLAGRLRRRALVILFTEFVDTVTAEIMVESLGRLGGHHAVMLVTLRDEAFERSYDAEPSSFEAVAASVVAEQFRRDRQVVLGRLARLGLHMVDVPPAGLSVAVVNKYLDVKARGLL